MSDEALLVVTSSSLVAVLFRNGVSGGNVVLGFVQEFEEASCISVSLLDRQHSESRFGALLGR